MSLKVITISGYARHGKDTVAKFLQEQLESNGNRVLITHYADLLKYICKTFFKWNGKKDEAGRTLLQHVGTDVVRKKEPNFWVDFVADILCNFGDCWDFVIIPDTRFPNEIERLKERNLDVVHLRVVRPDFESPLTAKQQAHSSETALDNTAPDYRIINSGDLDTLKSKIIEWIMEVLYEDK